MARQGANRIHEDDIDETDERGERPGRYGEEPDSDAEAELRARREERAARRAAGEANRARLRDEAKAAIGRAERGGQARKAQRPAPVEARERAPLVPRSLPDPKRQLAELLGSAAGGRAWRDLNQAAEHLDAGRSGSARPIAERLYRRASDVLEVAEIWGHTLYGLGRWDEAIEVLEDVRERSGLPDNNPVLADAHRARGHWADVNALWQELSEASPASSIVIEGRIVASGALADQGDLQGAVRLLSKGWKRPKRPLEHHLRRAYALGDLYERAGERPRAQELFAWISHHDDSYLDAAERAR